jgi:hypothetical protein
MNNEHNTNSTPHQSNLKTVTIDITSLQLQSKKTLY